MGATYLFTCQQCGYENDVGQGRDCGFHGASFTITRPYCKMISDLAIYEPFDTPWNRKNDFKVKDLKCPDCLGPIKRWKVGVCPKCGGLMRGAR